MTAASTLQPSTTPNVGEHRADHDTAESHFVRVLTALQEGIGGPVEVAWPKAEGALVEHFGAVERATLGQLLRSSPEEARNILQEHAYLRMRMAQIRSRLSQLAAADVESFLVDLRAHRRHEEELLRCLSEESAADC